jgi:isopentenyl-diphosphate Delta-isomerase
MPELIVTVDEFDNVIGTEDKEKCHDGEGILHRAFLAMVFDASGKLVLARRSEKKRLWPGFWDGTVASHLLSGEDYIKASRRRLAEEIGLTAPSVKYLFKFRYKVPYKDVGTEHEICAVTALHGVDARKLRPDIGEIAEIRLIGVEELLKEMRSREETFAPWFLMAVERMNNDGFRGLY